MVRMTSRMEDPVAEGIASPGGVAARETAQAQAAKVWAGGGGGFLGGA